MKKWRIGTVFALAIVALVGGTTAYAAGYGGGHHGWYASNPPAVSATVLSRSGSCWGDTDGDGVCDLCGRTGYGYVNADDNGICDNYGTGWTGRGHHGGGHCRW